MYLRRGAGWRDFGSSAPLHWAPEMLHSLGSARPLDAAAVTFLLREMLAKLFFLSQRKIRDVNSVLHRKAFLVRSDSEFVFSLLVEIKWVFILQGHPKANLTSVQ